MTQFKVLIDHAPLLIQDAGELIYYQDQLYVILEDADDLKGKTSCRPVAEKLANGRFHWHMTERDLEQISNNIIVDRFQLTVTTN